ncbi:alpha/beta fold hydrolase [Nocardioides sp. SOB44]|uniref:Alpha/beta fold hydrolase n=1 Tax=Nocardioides cremeus TaxID=3058044 RepID=A0ABT8TQZ3_9ACTN|nr:alpha/beta fold hydrolase [Nocardioides cremeus]MDO3396385.1 alpha/beta fold hydrolase [Nocardioides cremeus]
MPATADLHVDDLHVSTHGRPDAPVTVLLAHCWTADETDWHYQVQALLDRFGHEVRLVTWDHRGHGRSARVPESACTIADLARDLGRVVDAHAAAGPLVLAGHSIGGMCLMALPEERPDLVERVAGLLLVSTSSGRLDTVTLGLPDTGRVVRAQIPRLLAARAQLLSRRRRRGSPSVERWVVNRFLFGSPLRLRDAGLVLDQLISCAPATMAGFYRDCMRHERTAALAAYDDVPTVVMVGSADVLTPPAHAQRTAAAIRGARLVVAPGAGHYLPLERDELVSEHLVAAVEQALADAHPQAHAAAG